MARTNSGFLFIKTLNGAPPAIQQWPVASGTYYEGMPLRIGATTGSAKAFVGAGTAVLGVCGAYTTKARSTLATVTVPVYMADYNNVFEVKTGGAIAAPRTLLADFVACTGATSSYRAATAGGKQCRVVGFPADATTSSHANARLWVTFAKNYWTDNTVEVAGH